jgi:hypothetical protein
MQAPEQRDTDDLTADSVAERHDRELTAFKALTDPERMRQQLMWRARYAADPWSFLKDCVITLDQVNESDAIKPFPSYKRYCRFITKLWLREKLLAIPKSRRMICSWTFISLFLHDTIFKHGRYNAFVSKKEDDSGELVERAEFIFKHIPEWRIPRKLLPVLKNGKMSKQPPLLEFEEIYSKIQGFPQGATQLRQFTFSGLLFDEWAFWEEAQAAYSAAKPTIEGGGRLTGISSRSPGFFKKIVFDQLDAKDLTFRESPPVPAEKPIEGIEVWRNPRNKFVICDLHYTADPAKRGEVWRRAVRDSMPIRDFLMEYERSWQTFEGKPVYEDFNRTLHVGRPVVEPGIPLLLGWDFGLTPACLIAQLVGRQLRIFHEFVETDGSISKLGPVVWNFLMVNFLTWMHNQREQVISYIDPAGFDRKDTDERSCADVLRVCGDLENQRARIGFYSLRPGPVRWEPRRKAVETFLTRTYGEGPGLLIDEAACPILIEGFTGGYRYPEKALEIEPADIRPLKNKYSHPHDGLQYLAAGATQLRRTHTTGTFTAPSYGFQQQQQQQQVDPQRMRELGFKE